MAVCIYITIFMAVMLYRLVGGYQHSKGTCCLHPQGLNEWCEDAAMKMVNHTHGIHRYCQCFCSVGVRSFQVLRIHGCMLDHWQL